jgi:hypothetical protein
VGHSLIEAVGPGDGGRAQKISKCEARGKLLSNCPFAPPDPDDFLDDASYARMKGEPVSQIEESFADFMGAEVAGATLKARGVVRQDSARYDDLFSIATDFAHLHGHCLKQNSLDAHPAGYLRMGRNFLGSQGFREQMCGTGAPAPAFPGAGVTCRGF